LKGILFDTEKSLHDAKRTLRQEGCSKKIEFEHANRIILGKDSELSELKERYNDKVKRAEEGEQRAIKEFDELTHSMIELRERYKEQGVSLEEEKFALSKARSDANIVSCEIAESRRKVEILERWGSQPHLEVII